MPKGTRIDVRLTYDNSAENPRNPSNPPKRVMWGEQSFDEMGSVTVLAVAARKEDEPILQQFLAERLRTAISAGVRNGTAQRFAKQRQAPASAGGSAAPK